MSSMYEDDPANVWTFSKRIRMAMFVARHGDDLDGRPLQAHPDEEVGIVTS